MSRDREWYEWNNNKNNIKEKDWSDYLGEEEEEVSPEEILNVNETGYSSSLRSRLEQLQTVAVVAIAKDFGLPITGGRNAIIERIIKTSVREKSKIPTEKEIHKGSVKGQLLTLPYETIKSIAIDHGISPTLDKGEMIDRIIDINSRERYGSSYNIDVEPLTIEGYSYPPYDLQLIEAEERRANIKKQVAEAIARAEEHPFQQNISRLYNLNREDLRDLARFYGLPISGRNKEELIQHIRDYLGY